MLRRIHRLLLGVYQRTPVLGRRWIVRTIAPSYTVGAMVIIERDDGAVLLVRQAYRQRWGVPGGLLQRREDADEAARREVREEVGLDIELLGAPAVVVDPQPQRVDLVYRARPVEGADLEQVEPCSPEITEVGWFPLDGLPELQFETSGALVELARSARHPQARPMVDEPDLRDRPAG